MREANLFLLKELVEKKEEKEEQKLQKLQEMHNEKMTFLSLQKYLRNLYRKSEILRSVHAVIF